MKSTGLLDVYGKETNQSSCKSAHVGFGVLRRNNDNVHPLPVILNVRTYQLCYFKWNSLYTFGVIIEFYCNIYFISILGVSSQTFFSYSCYLKKYDVCNV